MLFIDNIGRWLYGKYKKSSAFRTFVDANINVRTFHFKSKAKRVRVFTRWCKLAIFVLIFVIFAINIMLTRGQPCVKVNGSTVCDAGRFGSTLMFIDVWLIIAVILSMINYSFLKLVLEDIEKNGNSRKGPTPS